MNWPDGSQVLVRIDKEKWVPATVVRTWTLEEVQEVMPAFTATDPLTEVMICEDQEPWPADTWWAWSDQIQGLDLPETREPEAIERWLARG